MMTLVWRPHVNNLTPLGQLLGFALLTALMTLLGLLLGSQVALRLPLLIALAPLHRHIHHSHHRPKHQKERRLHRLLRQKINLVEKKQVCLEGQYQFSILKEFEGKDVKFGMRSEGSKLSTYLTVVRVNLAPRSNLLASLDPPLYRHHMEASFHLPLFLVEGLCLI